MSLYHRIALALVVALSTAFVPYSAFAAEKTDPVVRMTTSLGAIELELDRGRAPTTAANFLKYVKDGFYNGTIFHRVIPGFMVQGGGFEPGMQKKRTRDAIKNEAGNGLKNVTGSIAMARTRDPHSATSQFFINTVDNARLDKSADGWGYAVFGKVIKGMDVIKKIESSPTGRVGTYGDVPKKDIIIKKIEVVKP